MQTLLYATDYSQNSVAALIYAHNLCFHLRAKLLLLHVFDHPATLATKVSLAYLKKERQLQEEHRIKLEAFCWEHTKDRPVVSDMSAMAMEDSSPTAGIIKACSAHGVDMVVVGTKGKSALKEFFLGSTATGLIKKAPCSVMTVPAYNLPKPIRTLVYATDFEDTDILAIQKLVHIAAPFKATIKIVHVTPKNESDEDRKVAWIKKMLALKVDYKPMEVERIFSEDILKGLHAYIQRSDVSILGMLEREEGGLLGKFGQKDLVLEMESFLSIPLISFNVAGL